jgi:TonB family protein
MATRLIHFSGKSTSAVSSSRLRPHVHTKGQVLREKRQMKSFAGVINGEGKSKWLGTGFLVVCSFVLLFFHLHEKWLVPSTSKRAALEAHNTSVPNLTPSAKLENTQPGKLAKIRTSVAVQSASSQAPSQDAAPDRIERKVIAMPDAVPTALPGSAVQRSRISEWPQSGFEYPIAPNGGLSGTVTLMAVVGTDGTVSDVEVMSGSRQLARTAVEAVRHWRYSPHKLNGIPVEAETRIVIDFRGEDAVSIRFPPAK